jgi:hypothetical protein
MADLPEGSAHIRAKIYFQLLLFNRRSACLSVRTFPLFT